MATELGKRYRCEKCGGQLICVKPGHGALACCGEPMILNAAAALPAAD